MVQYSFLEWLKQRENLQEVQTVAGAIYNPFAKFQQKEGDFVYFGVHEMARAFRETGQIPRLDVNQVLGKSGRIVDADPINMTLTIATDQDPYKFGYHKLSLSQRRGRPIGGTTKIKIPFGNLEQITHMLPTGEQLSGQRLWLVVDGSTKHQEKLRRAVRAAEEAQKKTTQQHAQPEISQDQIARAKQSLGVPRQIRPEDPKMAFDRLFNPTAAQAPAQQYTHQGRNIVHAGDPEELRRQNMQTHARVRARRNQGLTGDQQVAWYDPTFTGFDRHWKSFVDATQYEYYPV